MPRVLLSCPFNILRVYSVALLPLLPLHGNSFPNFLSSPLAAILPHLLTKTPVSLKWFFSPRNTQACCKHSASSLTASPCYSAITQEKSYLFFSTHSGCCSCCLGEKKKNSNQEEGWWKAPGCRAERWLLINPTMSKNTSKTVTSLHIMEKPPLINSNCKLMQFVTSARIKNHGTNSVVSFNRKDFIPTWKKTSQPLITY